MQTITVSIGRNITDMEALAGPDKARHAARLGKALRTHRAELVGPEAAPEHFRLRRHSWEWFQADVRNLLRRYGSVVFYGEGIGADPTTGKEEPSFTVVLAGEVTGLHSLRRLHDSLTDLAKTYCQDSIACTIANSGDWLESGTEFLSPDYGEDA